MTFALVQLAFCWVAADSGSRLALWEGDSEREQLKLHRSLLAFGQTILTAKEFARFSAAGQLPSTETMARQADEHWPERVPGLHPTGLLSFHGLYQAVYRVGSRSTHGSFAALASGRPGDHPGAPGGGLGV